METPLKLVMVGIVTGSHVLIDDVPGVGKTTLVRILARLLGLSFQRIQFTPDLMPTDVTGTSVLDMRTNDFAFRPGPLFAQVVLADEINRATPKTQAALLEAMQEHQVTVDGVSPSAARAVLRAGHPEPDRAGGHLPAARGAARPVPAARSTRVSERRTGGAHPHDHPRATTVADGAARRGARDPRSAGPGGRRRARAPRPPLHRVALARATRDHPELSVGASPRAVEQMGDAARAWSLLDGRDYVLPDDVKLLAEPVFGHRLVPTTDARIRDRTADEILREVLRSVPVPTEFREG